MKRQWGALWIGLLILGMSIGANAQVRIAVLHQSQNFTVIHPDTVDLAVLEVNLNPDNPQFLSDRWIVAAKLGADKVITGTLNVRYGKVFVNVYVYDIETKKAVLQLRNLYRSQEQYLELVERILPKLVKYFNQ